MWRRPVLQRRVLSVPTAVRVCLAVPGSSPPPPFAVVHNVSLSPDMNLGWNLANGYLVSEVTLKQSAWWVFPAPLSRPLSPVTPAV